MISPFIVASKMQDCCSTFSLRNLETRRLNAYKSPWDSSESGDLRHAQGNLKTFRPHWLTKQFLCHNSIKILVCTSTYPTNTTFLTFSPNHRTVFERVFLNSRHSIFANIPQRGIVCNTVWQTVKKNKCCHNKWIAYSTDSKLGLKVRVPKEMASFSIVIASTQ